MEQVSEDFKIQLKAVISQGQRSQKEKKCKMQVFLLHPQYNSAFMKSFKNICDLIQIVIVQGSALEHAP